MFEPVAGSFDMRSTLDSGGISVMAGDGCQYKLRRIRPSDAASLIRGYQAMSQEDKLSRMFYRVPEMTTAMAERFCSPGAERDFCIVVEGRDALEGEILGGARITEAGKGGSHEFSVSLRPEGRHKGLAAAALASVLKVAQEMGSHSVWGVITSDNEPMLSLAKKLGFTLRPKPEDPTETVARIELKKP
ncbi:MAG: N-acetyltransferase family protein [Hyphomicrobiaceae bacterium]